MRTNLENARYILETGDYTCVFYKADTARTCTQRGVKPLLELLDAGDDLRGWSVADKVVGKAAAMLYVCMQVREVYAQVMSDGAVRTLLRHGIAVQYATLTDRIQNRRGDGLCPMESAVWDVDDPNEAFGILKSKVG
jgi:hypothetical protein